MIGIEDIDGAILDPLPERCLCPRVAGGAAHRLRAEHVGHVEVLLRQQEILRAGFRDDDMSSRPRPPDFIERISAADMDDDERHARDFRERNGPVRGFALDWKRAGMRVGDRICTARPLEAVSQPADDLVVFGMDQHDGLFLPGRFEHVEDLAIAELHRLIGHIDLEAGMSAPDQGRQLLPKHGGRWVTDDEVKGIVPTVWPSARR